MNDHKAEVFITSIKTKRPQERYPKELNFNSHVGTCPAKRRQRKGITPLRKTNDAKQEIIQILGSSMLTGVPEIMNAPNSVRKVMKTMVFFACIGGFIYQAWQFMDMYWKYPTVIDIQVKHPDTFEMPAITLCNNNGIRRQLFCGMVPSACENPEIAPSICKAYPLICLKLNDTNDLLVPKLNLYEESEKYFKFDDPYKKFFGHQFLSMVNVTWAPSLPKETIKNPKSISEHVFTVTTADFAVRKMLCHTLFSTFALNLSEPYVFKSSAGTDNKFPGSLKLFSAELEYEGWEYFRIRRPVGASLAIHSPTVITNAFINGLPLSGGKAAIVQVSMTEYNLLPKPYGSDCYDYKAEWKEKGGGVPLSKEMCIEKCSIYKLFERCNCTAINYMYPHSLKQCIGNSSIVCIEKIADEVERNCRKNCKTSCKYTVYDYTVIQSDIESDQVNYLNKTEAERNELSLKTKGTLDIYMKRPEVVVFTYVSKFESVETFSYIGGYVGMWLGISLIAVFDFIESMVLLSKFCVKHLVCATSKNKKAAISRKTLHY